MSHEQIAERVAEAFIGEAYVHTVHQDHEWAIGTPRVEMTPESLKRALALALATFALEYGLTPPSPRGPRR